MANLNKYQLGKHKVNISEEGLSYFINNDGEVVLCQGEAPYLKEEIIVPEIIDGKPVVAIAEKAFQNSKFFRMFLPNSISYIANDAFCNASFMLLKLPDLLKYLGNCFTFNEEITGELTYDDLVEISKKENGSATDIHDINDGHFSCFVSCPQNIEEVDDDFYSEYAFLIKETAEMDLGELEDSLDDSYDIGQKSFNGHIYFDRESMSIYGLLKDSTAVLLFARSDNLSNFPLIVDGIALRAWDLFVFKRFNSGLHIEIDSMNEDEATFHLASGSKTSLKEKHIKVPEHVVQITNYFSTKISLYEPIRIELPNKIKIINGFEDDWRPIFVKNTVAIVTTDLTVLLEKGSKARVDTYHSIVEDVTSAKEEDDGFHVFIDRDGNEEEFRIYPTFDEDGDFYDVNDFSDYQTDSYDYERKFEDLERFFYDGEIDELSQFSYYDDPLSAIASNFENYNLYSSDPTLLKRARKLIDQGKARIDYIDTDALGASIGGYKQHIQFFDNIIDISCNCPECKDNHSKNQYDLAKCVHLTALIMRCRTYKNLPFIVDEDGDDEFSEESEHIPIAEPKNTTKLEKKEIKSSKKVSKTDSSSGVSINLLTIGWSFGFIFMLIAFIVILATKAEVSVHIEDGGEIVSKSIVHTLHMGQYIGGLPIALFIVGLLVALIFQFIKKKFKKSVFLLVLLPIADALFIVFAFIAKGKMLAYKPEPVVPSWTVIVDYAKMGGSLIVGVVFVIVSLLLFIFVFVKSILEMKKEKKEE